MLAPLPARSGEVWEPAAARGGGQGRALRDEGYGGFTLSQLGLARRGSMVTRPRETNLDWLG